MMSSFENALRTPQASPSTSQSDAPAPQGTCRACGAPLHHTFVDLGMSPLCETYLRPAELNGMEPFYPLRVFVCDRCFLVQLQEYVSPTAIFTGMDKAFCPTRTVGSCTPSDT